MEFLEKIYYHNTVLQWAIALGIILGGVIFAKILYWFTSTIIKKITAKTKTKLDDLLVDKLEKPIIFIVIIAAYYWAISYLNFPTDAVGKTNGLENLLFKLSTFMGIIIGMDNLGIDITAMIAGLGIGGLALALAAQDMVKNIFGGIMIFLDKPFKIGERIQIDGFDGTVEEVGLRSTRVRTLEGRLLIINNSTFSDNTVVNVSAEHTRKVVLNLGMTYDTTPKQMQQSMDILKEIVIAHPAIETEDASIGFNAYGDFALGILFVYRIKKEGDILQTQTEINLEILKRFNGEGLEFAFPTQTVFKKEMV